MILKNLIMKILKLVTLTVIISCSNYLLFAQKFGIRAGGNASTIVMKDNDNTYTATLMPGFHVGVFYNFELKNTLSFNELFIYCCHVKMND